MKKEKAILTFPQNLHDDNWFNSLDENTKNEFGSVSIYRCPSRRGSGPKVSKAYSGGSSCVGPRSDYA